MAKNLDDMPEIELDEIVKPNATIDDGGAIELEFDSLPLPTVSPATMPSEVQFDDEAIDLGIDLDLDAHPEPTIDVDALASRVASTQPDPAANDVPVIPGPNEEPAPVTEFPRLPSPNEATVDLDALLADIETGLEVRSPSVEAKSMSGVSQVSLGVDALPQVGDDPLSALNVELDGDVDLEAEADVEPGVEVEAEFEVEDDVELNLDDLNVTEDEPDVELDAADVTLEASGINETTSPEDADLEVEVEAEELSPSERETLEVPAVETDDFVPEPLLDMLHEEPTLPSPTVPHHVEPDPVAPTEPVFAAPPPAAQPVAEDEISFEAEHAPIADSPLPLIVTPDDPDAPPLPLSAKEPPGQPKVPLERLQPDPRTIETLRKLAGPSGDPEDARFQLLAAFRGEAYQKSKVPEAKDIALGIGRYLVQQGHDPDAIVEAVLSVLNE
ncbi:MAG: hypothetical protein AAF654_11355 [Myxococcota bacterium]